MIKNRNLWYACTLVAGLLTLHACQETPAPIPPKTQTPAPTTAQTPIKIDLSLIVNHEGEITFAGKKVPLEQLSAAIQEAVGKLPLVPDQIPVKYEGEVLMGMRAEVLSEINAALAAARAAKAAKK